MVNKTFYGHNVTDSFLNIKRKQQYVVRNKLIPSGNNLNYLYFDFIKRPYY